MINKLIKWLQKYENNTIFTAAVFFTFTVAALITGLVATFIDAGLVSLVVFISSFFGLRWLLNKYIVNPAIAMKKEVEDLKLGKGEIGNFTLFQDDSNGIVTEDNIGLDTTHTVEFIIEYSPEEALTDTKVGTKSLSEQQRKIHNA